MPPEAAVAVTLHGVEPATWARCALIRDWLADQRVGRVTLVVAGRPGSCPVQRRALVEWLADRLAGGDRIVQPGSGPVPRGPGEEGLRRLDLHPGDLDLPGRVGALEARLRR